MPGDQQPIEEKGQTPEPPKSSRNLISNAASRKRISLDKGNSLANQRFILGYKIGQGSFGQVYLGIQNPSGQKQIDNTSERQVAIKIQLETANKASQLLNQQQILSKIQQDAGYEGFPTLIDYGSQGSANYLVMQLLGPNLQDLLIMCGGKFSLKTTILLGVQIMERLQVLHSKGFVFRDIKPQNFTMGIGKKSHVLYIIDFGLSKKYQDQKTQLHYPYRQDRVLTGTIRYSSVNAHLGIQQSRRDDLQAFCYLLIYFLRGKLPWQGVKNQGKVQKQHTIMQMKLKMPVYQICAGLPAEFFNILTYCRDLGYYEDPQYAYIIGELNSLYARQGYHMNSNYDWVSSVSQKSHRNSLIQLRISHDNNKNAENLCVDDQDQQSIQQGNDSLQFLQ